MKTTIKSTLATVAALFFSATTAYSQNPIVQTCFSTDPAPIVHGEESSSE